MTNVMTLPAVLLGHTVRVVAVDIASVYWGKDGGEAKWEEHKYQRMLQNQMRRKKKSSRTVAVSRAGRRQTRGGRK